MAEPSASTDAANAGQYTAELTEASRRFAISPVSLRAIMLAESDGNPAAVSSKGAIGLMQLMPDTYADIRQQFALGADPFRPSDNIMAGTAYLRQLMDRYGASGAVAAYNAGPKRYERWLGGAASLPSETRAFVARVRSMLSPAYQIAAIHAQSRSASSPASAPLFVTVGVLTSATGEQPRSGSVQAHSQPGTQPREANPALRPESLFPASTVTGARQ